MSGLFTAKILQEAMCLTSPYKDQSISGARGEGGAGGPDPPPPPAIKIPPMIKNYNNLAQQCLVAVTDDKGAPGPLTNNQGAPN